MTSVIEQLCDRVDYRDILCTFFETEDKKKLLEVNKNLCNTITTKIKNIKNIANIEYNNITITNEVIKPYTIYSKGPCKTQYEYILLYCYMNKVPIAIQMLDSHIFMVRIPNDDKTFVEEWIHNDKMEEFHDYYFLNYLCMRKNEYAHKLGVFYMNTLKKKYYYSIRKDGNLKEKSIFAILFKCWERFYNKKTPTTVLNDYNYYDAVITNKTDVCLFNTDYKNNEYIKLDGIL